MKVLVTGGSGFIGRYVLRELAESGHGLRCLLRPTSDPAHVKEVHGEVAIGDVTDRSSIDRAVKGCDAVVNLANLYEFWPQHFGDYRAVNVEGTRKVMEAALEAGVSKVVHVSTLCVYGGCKDAVWTETSPEGAAAPSRYVITKREGDRIAWDLHRTQGLPLVVVYPAAVTGAGDDKPSAGYFEALLKRRMPAQVLVRTMFTWVHVADVARIIVAALEKEGNIGERYFAAAERVTFGELNMLVSELSGVRLPLLTMPTPMLVATAGMLTFLGRVFGLKPMLGMSLDQIRTMKLGLRGDGSKAAEELRIEYRPIRTAVREIVEEIRNKQKAGAAIGT